MINSKNGIDSVSNRSIKVDQRLQIQITRTNATENLRKEPQQAPYPHNVWAKLPLFFIKSHTTAPRWKFQVSGSFAGDKCEIMTFEKRVLWCVWEEHRGMAVLSDEYTNKDATKVVGTHFAWKVRSDRQNFFHSWHERKIDNFESAIRTLLSNIDHKILSYLRHPLAP